MHAAAPTLLLLDSTGQTLLVVTCAVLAGILLIIILIALKDRFGEWKRNRRRRKFKRLLEAEIENNDFPVDPLQVALMEITRSTTGAHNVNLATNPRTGRIHLRRKKNAASIDPKGKPQRRAPLKDDDEHGLNSIERDPEKTLSHPETAQSIDLPQPTPSKINDSLKKAWRTRDVDMLDVMAATYPMSRATALTMAALIADGAGDPRAGSYAHHALTLTWQGQDEALMNPYRDQLVHTRHLGDCGVTLTVTPVRDALRGALANSYARGGDWQSAHHALLEADQGNSAVRALTWHAALMAKVPGAIPYLDTTERTGKLAALEHLLASRAALLDKKSYLAVQHARHGMDLSDATSDLHAHLAFAWALSLRETGRGEEAWGALTELARKRPNHPGLREALTTT